MLQENLELDRAMAAKEAGYCSALLKLLQPELTTKADMIVGVPKAHLDTGAASSDALRLSFSWPW
jgi:hypothetical protein